MVDRFCERLGLGEVVLVGNSMGGFIAAEVAIRRPQRVERLVLVSAAGISIHSLHRRPVRTWGRAAVALGAYGAAHIQPRSSGRVCATSRSPAWSATPRACAPDICWEMMSGAGHSPGFTEALERAPRLRLPRAASATSASPR